MISARGVTRMAVVAAMVLLAAGACQASVIANLSITVDEGAKTWSAYLTLSDTANETLGLHGVYIDVWGSETEYGNWTGGLEVDSFTHKLPSGFALIGGSATIIGFGNLPAGTAVDTGYELVGSMQASVHTYDATYDNILTTVGEAAGSAPALAPNPIVWSKPVLVAEGTYTGDVGWLNVSLYKNDSTGEAISVTVLPDTLPASGESFATFYPQAGDDYRDSVYVPEPATLGLLALGGAVLAARRRKG